MAPDNEGTVDGRCKPVACADTAEFDDPQETYRFTPQADITVSELAAICQQMFYYCQAARSFWEADMKPYMRHFTKGRE